MTARRAMWVVAALLGALAAVSCSTSGSTFTPVAGDGSASPAAELGVDEAVELVGLTEADLDAKYTLEVPSGGDQVEGQVTLDGCGYDFTTESMRVARRQVWIEPAGDKQSSYSNEVVAYESPAAARLAFRQYKDSALNCPPDKFTPSGVADLPPLRIQLLDFELHPTVPVKPAIATYQRVTTKAGDSLYATFIFQQRGSFLDAHYLLTAKAPSDAQSVELARQAEVTGTRLSGLPRR